MSNETSQKSLELHQQNHGKLEIKSKVSIKNRQELAIAYTPGVGAVCSEIAKNPELAKEMTLKNNTIAVISDGTAVLGLGNIGPEASLPVLEGKAILFKEMGGLDAFPIALNVHEIDQIVSTIKAISPGFAGINLEDIAAPQCFEIEEKLQDLNIPVMHDDQHGTAIVIYAALLNSCKVTGQKMEDLTVVINGAGAAGIASAKMLIDFYQTGNPKVKNLILCDSQGIISKERNDLNKYKAELLPLTNLENKTGNIEKALENSNVFIGLSKANLLNQTHIKSMAPSPFVFAMANPVPEIMPDQALEAGAAIVATGRSDFDNQINNALVFPGIFRAALTHRFTKITPEVKYACALAIADSVIPQKTAILPDIFSKEYISKISEYVGKAKI